MKKNKYRFSFVDGKAQYIIRYKKKEFCGESFCHPEDKDFESEKVGLLIAETRAAVKVLKYIRDCELKPFLNGLNHILASMNRGKKYNLKSQEYKLIKRQFYITKKEINNINEEIFTLNNTLTSYIEEKDKFYKKIRKARSK